ncbi:ATP-binding protein [Tepidibacter mesophilus]|uniref:HAMP domain-containing histidine kinase n=1 Tax=Tepidibacter mesophilus TaxID=655607 RepID=UPI000C0869F7|nr:HAMP domain-containing histidine kinase [Tepidibacter mesophilus]
MKIDLRSLIISCKADKIDSLIYHTEEPFELTAEVEIVKENNKPEFYIKNINTIYNNYLKISPKEIIGKNIIDLYEPSSARLYYEIALKIYNNKIEDNLKIYIKNINNENRIISYSEIELEEEASYLEISVYPLVEDNEIKKMFIIIKNITRHLKEIHLLKKQYVVKNYNDKITSISDMISNLSHVWRQPLNSLNFCILNLIDELKDECEYCVDLEDYYNEMWDIMKNLSKKIDKFQSFFELSEQNECFGVKKCLDLTFEIMEEKIKKDNIKINIEMHEEINIYSSPNQFSQLIYHIFCDMIECCRQSLDINDRILDIKIDLNANIMDVKIISIYDKEKYKTIDFNLENLFTIKNIVEQRMNGTISLIDDGLGKGVLLNFPMAAEEV